jgi:glycine/D-amino acid oxidase-like deaminating enzyme
MSDVRRVAVIGCGVFGAMAAIRLAESGMDVKVFERKPAPLMGASFNNQNRLHLGFHYPRDDATAQQCIRGFQRFREEFPECINGGFVNAYFIASSGSLTSADDYLNFCDRLGLRYERLDLKSFKPHVRDVDLGVAVQEVVYDCRILRGLIERRLASSNVASRFGADVERIVKQSNEFTLEVNGSTEGPFDTVVNCTYGDVNRLGEQLGHAIPERQYEYTLVPIIEWARPPVGITVMDGPFMTVLPFGHTGQFLLYHVHHTVVARTTATQLPIAWRDVATSPASTLDREAFFNEIIQTCQRFVPDFAAARLAGFLEGPRVVLAHRDTTDARPSIVQVPESGYVSVFAGKIDHCIWIADEVVNHVLSDDRFTTSIM